MTPEPDRKISTKRYPASGMTSLPIRRLPAYALNGIEVAIGIGLIQLLFVALFGSNAAQLTLSGAVCASLADVANTGSRTWHRVSAAAVLSGLAALVVARLKPHPIGLGVSVALIALVAMLTMAWGLRAAAVSFAPILSLVFSMAVPHTGEPWFALAGWNALGGAAYLAWSLVAGRALQRRYRTLALAAALRAAAQLPQLRTIELRDVLLANRLDLDRLGNDAAGRWVLQRVALALRQTGQAMASAAIGCARRCTAWAVQWRAHCARRRTCPPAARRARPAAGHGRRCGAGARPAARRAGRAAAHT